MQDTPLFTIIRWWRRATDAAHGLWALVAVGTVVWLVAWCLTGWDCWGGALATLSWGSLGAGVAALLFAWWRHVGDAKTAARLDRRFGLRNRLESAVELRRGVNPIRERQLAEAERAWRTVSRRRRLLLWWPVLGGIVAAALWLGSVNGCRTRWMQAWAAQGATVEREVAAVPEVAAEPVPEADQRIAATLELSYPDEETEFMPIDLIEWEGAARGAVAWREIEMRVVLNGVPLSPSPVALAAPAGEEGKRYLGGGVALDEMAAAPNDLVGLQLAGVIAVGDGERRVFSAPVLLRLKPLRDELRILDIPGGGTGAAFRDFHNYALELIRRQSELLRLFFAGRGEWELGGGDDVESTLFSPLAEEQEKLAAELAAYLLTAAEEEGPGALTALMLQELNRATAEMRLAAAQLRALTDDGTRSAALDAAPAAQQRALAALNAALQELTKVVRKQRDEPAAGTPDQGASELKSNVLEQLDLAILSQTELIAAFRTAGIQPELRERQGVVTVTLKALNLRLELSAATLAALSAAQGASELAEVAIPSNAPRALEMHTQEALAQMKEARRLIEKQSRMQRADALGAARRALAAAQRENRRAANSDDAAAEKSAAKLDAGAQALAAAAEELATQGAPVDAAALRSPAEKMGALAAALPGMARAAAGEEMANLRRELQAASGGSAGNSAGELSAALDRLRREAAYLEKNPETDPTGWLEELEGKLEDLDDYLDAVDPARSPTEVARLRDTMSRIPDQLDGWFYAGIAPGDYAGIVERLGVLSQGLTALELAGNAPTEMFLFAPDQVPEKYRELAAAYFEALSRRRSAAGGAAQTDQEKP